MRGKDSEAEKIKMVKWVEITARENHEACEGRFLLKYCSILIIWKI